MIAISCAVVGAGFVGSSMCEVFAERGVNVYSYDKAGKRPQGVNPFQAVSVSELVEHCEQQEGFSGIFFVSVPTPMQETGECDLSIVEGVLRELANAPRQNYKLRVAVVKSTVQPGSCARWNRLFSGKLSVVHSPEFLRERTALQDMRDQNRIVIGGDTEALDKVEVVFASAFPNVPIIRTNTTTSEMVKYFTNVQLTARLVLSCEFCEICNKLNDNGNKINYDEVVRIASLDDRLGGSHMTVPGHDGIMGARGSCFPKDLGALTYLASKLGIANSLLKAIKNKNLALVHPDHRDWEKMVGRGVSVKVVKQGRFPIHPIVAKVWQTFVGSI